MFPIHDDNPSKTIPFVTIGLILACVVVYFWQISHTESVQQAIVFVYGVVPGWLLDDATHIENITGFPVETTLFTAMFLHGGFMHLLGNMLFLWIFGNNVEDAMGHFRFIIFYLLCGVIATLAHALPNPLSTVPMIGASGAISGVLGAYLLLYPHARVLVMIPLGFYLHTSYLPASLVLGFWFVIQIISSLAANPEQGGVAWYAHIGGFAAGMLLIPLFKYRRVPLWHRPRY